MSIQPVKNSADRTRIRIVHTIRQGSFGGGETYLFNLAKSLDPARYENIVLSFTEGNMVNELRKLGFETHVIYTKKPFNVFVWPRVYALLRSLKPDLLHIHGTKAGSNTIFSARMLGIPAVYTVQGWSFHAGETELMNSTRINIERFLSHFVRNTVCVSFANQIEGEKAGIKARYKVIQNGIEFDKFHPGQPDLELRKQFDLEPDDTVIISLARITLQKDPLTLVTAFSKVVKQVDKVKLLFVGNGDMEAVTRAKVKELNLEKFVVFRPFTNSIAEMHNLSDIYVLPSLWEGLSLALMEAMAMEQACLSSDIDANQEMLKHGIDGLVHRVSDPDDLAEKLIILCKDPELRKRLGKEARKSAFEKFNLTRVVRQNDELYQEVLGVKR